MSKKTLSIMYPATGRGSALPIFHVAETRLFPEARSSSFNNAKKKDENAGPVMFIEITLIRYRMEATGKLGETEIKSKTRIEDACE